MLVWGRVSGEQADDVGCGVVGQARDEGVDVGVGLDLGGIDVELPASDQVRLLAEVDDRLEEALEQVDPQPLPDASETRVVGEVRVEGIPLIPAMRQVEAGCLDEPALGADTLEEHDQLQLEEVHGVDGGATPFGIQLSRPVADKIQVERRL
jgi:hypothetical protein